MHIENIEISNYKSFGRSQFIQLSKGLNIVIGKNNVGKTAFLEALTFFVNNPHKNNSTTKQASSSQLRASEIKTKLALTLEEIENYIVNDCNGVLYLDTDTSYPYYFHYDREHPGLDWYVENHTNTNESYSNHPAPYQFEDEVKSFFKNESFSILLETHAEKKQFKLEGLHKNFVDEAIRECYEFKIVNDDLSLIGTQKNVSDTFVKLTGSLIKNLVYKFEIYRTVGSNASITGNSVLLSDGSNLPSVLLYFQADLPGFRIYKEAVKEIFPEILDIIVHPNALNVSQIGIWNRTPVKNRIDLAIPLKDCGTGISQVLAILYLVVSSTSPQVIIIDEPNSFLHPSAARKLINILKRYPQHQYIISTHSPEIIASNPDNLILLTIEDGETNVKVLDTKQKQDIQYAMQEIGLKLSDIYGFDSILWVEGPTEQVCFPKIISRFYPKLEGNMAIVAVRHTGDFEKKYIDTTYSLYERISGSGSESFLIPPAIAFVFDREGKSEKEIEDWVRGGKKIHFTGVRLYENYILDEDAIAFVLNGYSTQYEWNRVYTPEEISGWIEVKKVDPKYWDNDPKHWDKNKKELEKKWREKIHAAKLLEDLFTELSETRVSYQKTIDSVKLTEYLLENKPEAFDSLKQLLDKFLPK